MTSIPDVSAAPAYRSEALDARGRVEALPSAMRVTSTWMQAVAWCFLATSIAVGLGSAWVTVPVQVEAGGVVVDTSGILLSSVIAPNAGYVEAFHVAVGDHVEKGHAIARLSLPEQSATVEKLRRSVASFQADNAALDGLALQERREDAQLRAQRQDGIERQMHDLERRLGWLKEQETAADGLLRSGLMTTARAIDMRVAVQNALFQIDQLRTERTQAHQTALEADIRRERDHRSRILRLDQAKLELAAAESTLATQAALRANISGRVMDLVREVGAPVTAGQPVALVSANTGDRPDDLEAIVYVPQSTGKQIAVGASVLLAPASLKSREHDRLRGRVKRVSSTIATRSTILKTLGSEQLYDLVARGGPVFEVVVALERNVSRPGQLVWTSGKAPEEALTRGTPISAKIAVEHVPLLGLALPALRGVLLREQSTWTGARS